MKYNTKNAQYLIRKFINHIMIDGKKQKAEKFFLEAVKFIQRKENKNALLFFFSALENIKPLVELRSVRRGGATYQIPIPLKEKRSLSLGIKSLLESVKKKRGSFSLNLSQVLLEASKNQGEGVKKRESIHSLALKNRSFTHFRWF